MSVVAVILTSIKIEKEVNLLKKGIQMNSLKNKVCKHTPNKNAISIVNDERFTFCENCEQNITSHYREDNDFMSYWTSWKVGK